MIFFELTEEELEALLDLLFREAAAYRQAVLESN